MKLGTYIHHKSGSCWKGLQGQGHDQTNSLVMAEAHISTVWRRGSFVCGNNKKLALRLRNESAMIISAFKTDLEPA